MPDAWVFSVSVSTCLAEIGSSNRQMNVDRGHVVIGGRDGQIGAPHLAVMHPQALEGLR